MKKSFLLAACFLVLTPTLFSSQQSEYYSYSFARLSYIKGDVFIERAGDLGYESADINLPVVEGDKLGTRDGRAEIHFGRNNYLRADNFCQVEFKKLPVEGDDLIRIHLLTGSVYLRIRHLEREKDFEVHTPDASFYILAEGLYRIDVRENKETELRVYLGAAEAAGEAGSVLVNDEERLVIVQGRFLSNPEGFYPSLYVDNFSEWNETREMLFAGKATNNYLPDELYEYEDELAYYGDWYYEQPYGYVWRPRSYGSAWSPYYYGRWVWYPICGWTWVSSDPWGWSTYHYGRWHWRLGFGWYWIPTRRWGPAWVYWYSGHRYMGWTPLSYYGHPVVIMNNRFYGRFSERYYPHRSRSLVVIHKNHFRSRNIARVALPHDRISRLGNITVSPEQPRLRHVVNRSSLEYKQAERAFSRFSSRSVSRNFSSAKNLTHRTSRVLGSRSTISRSSSSALRSGQGFRLGNPSSPISKRTRSPAGTLTRPSRTVTRAKTYPSRRGSVDRVRPSSSSKGVLNSSSPRNSRSIYQITSRSSSRRSSAILRTTYPSRRTAKSVRSRTTSSRSGSSSVSRRSVSTPSRTVRRNSVSRPPSSLTRSIRSSSPQGSSVSRRSSSPPRRSVSPRASSSRSRSISQPPRSRSVSSRSVSRGSPSRSSISRSPSRSSGSSRSVSRGSSSRSSISRSPSRSSGSSRSSSSGPRRRR